MLYMVDLKSMLSSLDKLYYGLDLDDATMYKVVGWSLKVPCRPVAFLCFWISICLTTFEVHSNRLFIVVDTW